MIKVYKEASSNRIRSWKSSLGSDYNDFAQQLVPRDKAEVVYSKTTWTVYGVGSIQVASLG